MVDNSSNKTIAKNTLLLYFRMIVTMFIALYTSRVVLQILGVDDYGIYQAVGGIVGLLSFVNNALATGSSRFLAYGLGEGDASKLQSIFSTTLTCPFGLLLRAISCRSTDLKKPSARLLYSTAKVGLSRFSVLLAPYMLRATSSSTWPSYATC